MVTFLKEEKKIESLKGKGHKNVLTKSSLFLLPFLPLVIRSLRPFPTFSVIGSSKTLLSKELPLDTWSKLWWAAWLFRMPFPCSLPLICIFICSRIRQHRKTSIIHRFKKIIIKKHFCTTIWFPCKCTQWLWSHPNPSVHHTSSVTLFWWIRRRLKSLFEDYRKGIPHVLVCACIGNLF